jgi:large subunit ribosomal protein L18
MKKKLNKKEKRIRRHKRMRAKIFGTATKPRVSVFISNRHMYAQVIDDNKGVTLTSISDFELKKKDKKTNLAKEMGLRLAEKMKKLKISKAIFDRGGFKYHGRVKNIAEGLREGGVKL